jgi:transcriptional regulator with XRE-family HTH domain
MRAIDVDVNYKSTMLRSMTKPKMNVRLVLGARARVLRRRLNRSQADVAREMVCDVSLVAHFEGGRRLPSAENLIRLADALGTTTDYLLGRRDHA